MLCTDAPPQPALFDLERALFTELEQMFGKVGRTVSGQPVKVTFKFGGPAPAWSIDDALYINAEGLNYKDLDRKGVIALLGALFHEVLHAMYTPRSYTAMNVWVRKENFMRSWNILEDQRIETIGTQNIYNLASLLIVTLRRLVIDPDAQLHPLVHGRRYLPLRVRQHFRNKWQAEYGDAAEIGALIDEYRFLTYPSDEERAREIVREFHQLISKHNRKDDDDRIIDRWPWDDCGHDQDNTELLPEDEDDVIKDAESAKDSEDDDDATIDDIIDEWWPIDEPPSDDPGPIDEHDDDRDDDDCGGDPGFGDVRDGSSDDDDSDDGDDAPDDSDDDDTAGGDDDDSPANDTDDSEQEDDDAHDSHAGQGGCSECGCNA